MRPNIVLILADDMGYGDVGALNPESRIPTPNMDRLASEGTVFTDAHSSSAVCTPSRYSILTGRYCWRSELSAGVLAGYEPPLIEPDRVTLPQLLSESGYLTAAVGKWHLGLGYRARPGAEIDLSRPLPWPAPDRQFEEQIDFEAPLTGGPLDLGFDSFFGTSSCPTCMPPYGWIEGDRFVEPPSVFETEYPYTGRPGMKSPSWEHRDADPIIAAKAVEFIRSAPSDRPFFLYVAPDAPHEPCVEEVVPEIAVGMSEAGPRGDLVWYFDHMVGLIDQAISDRGATDDTIVIVTSDNGALAGDRILEGGTEIYREYGHSSSGPWRGHKAHIWEGGHREPLIIRWPGRIPGGRTTDALFCLSDLLSTLAGLTGIAVPPHAAEDSFDTSAAWLGTGPSPRDGLISHSQRGVFAMRRGRWKAIFGTKGSGGWPPPAGGPPEPDEPGQLYDLFDDPSENSDLWDQRPDIVDELRATLHTAIHSGRTAP